MGRTVNREIETERVGRRVAEPYAERCARIGQYIAETGATVREAAAYFHMSKSSVHKDVHERLPACHPALAREVRAVLRYHMAVRHLRGGRATREKYLRGRGTIRGNGIRP